MADGRPNLVTLRHTFGTLTREFGARHADDAPDPAARDPRLQLGQALERLYAALNDLNRGHPLPLRHVWSDSPDATLLTPAAGLTRGWDAIRAHLDATAADTHRTLIAEDVAVTLCPDAAWAVCTERESAPAAPDNRWQSTNVFRRESGAWRLVHRQVAPAAVAPL
jgi:hypothetical protein